MTEMTRLLVLGATHLKRGSDREPDEALAPIIDRIVGWKPDGIAIEALPAEQYDSYLRLQGPFADMHVGVLPHNALCARAAQDSHDWTLWEARAVGQDPGRTPEERTIAWCAAYEPYTALLHARRCRELSTSVSEALAFVEANSGESWRVAGIAAARLGRERLHPIDDYTEWSASPHVPYSDRTSLMRSTFARAQAHPLVADVMAEHAEALAHGDLWPLWRRLNAPDQVAASNELESGYFHAYGSPERVARGALAGWRERNLSMAAKVRSVTGHYPGGRVLVLVGQAHKGPIEAALAADQWDLELADIAELDDQ